MTTVLPYWLARVFGVADGPHVKTCGVCRQSFPAAERQRGATGYPFPVCSSDACFAEACERGAW